MHSKDKREINLMQGNSDLYLSANLRDFPTVFGPKLCLLFFAVAFRVYVCMCTLCSFFGAPDDDTRVFVCHHMGLPLS